MKMNSRNRAIGLYMFICWLMALLAPLSSYSQTYPWIDANSGCYIEYSSDCVYVKPGYDTQVDALDDYLEAPWRCGNGIVDLCAPPDRGLDTVLVCGNTSQKCSEGYRENCGADAYFDMQTARCLPRPSKSGCFVNNPVNVVSGRKYQSETDYVSAGPLPISVQRTYAYNSAGYEWQFSQHAYLFWEDATTLRKRQSSYNGLPMTYEEGTDPRIVYIVQPDGGYDVFRYDTLQDAWLNDINTATSLSVVKNGNTITNWEWHDNATDLTRIFDAAGKLVALRDRHGVTVTLSYTGTVEIDSSRPSLSVTGDILISGPGIDITYRHDGNGRVSAVITPGGTIEYQYVSSASDDARIEYVIYPADIGQSKRPAKQYHYENTQFPYSLTGITDESGKRYATWRYNSDGLVDQAYHGAQLEKDVFVYDHDNHFTEVTNYAGKQTIYHYEEAVVDQQQVTRVEGQASANCTAANQGYEYDYTQGKPNKKTDWEGNESSYGYNERGLVIWQRSGDNPARQLDEQSISQKEIEWDDEFAVPTTIYYGGSSEGNLLEIYRTDEYTYTPQGRVESITMTDYESNSREFTYAYTYHDSAQTLVKTITKNGPLIPELQQDGVDDITIYTFDTDGNLTTVKNAYGHVVQYADYNHFGRPQSIIDSNQVNTKVTYTARGWVDTVSVLTAKGNSVTDFDYYDNGLLAKLTLPDLSYYVFEYNDARHLSAIVNQFGDRKEFTANGITGEWEDWVIKDSTNQIHFTKHRVFDELGRIMNVIGNNNQNTRYDLSSVGNIDAIEQDGFDVNRDQSEFETLTQSYVYDTLNHPLKSTDTANGETILAYNSQGLISSVTAPNELSTRYFYNGFGQVTRRESPDTGVTIYTYDPAGNLESVTDAVNHSIYYLYDALSRPILRATNQSDDQVIFEYDLDDEPLHDNGVGRLSRVSESNGNSNFAYNELGLVVQDQRTQLAGSRSISFTTKYQYNLAGDLVSMTYPSGTEVTYTRNQGQVSRLDATVAGYNDVLIADAFKYEPFGALKGYTFGNGATLTKSYDLDMRLDASTWSGALNLSTEYGHDRFDNIRLIDPIEIPNESQMFFYNKRQELVSANGAYGDINYSYDAIGNRLQRQQNQDSTSTTDTYHYPIDNSSNKLEAVEAEQGITSNNRTMNYNAVGNLTLEHRLSEGIDRLYDYDESGRLRSITDQVSPVQQ